MKTLTLHRLLAVLLVGLFSAPALAQFTRDASANQKIDEAINNHYLMMQLDKAEDLLTGTVAACEDKCSPATKAKAWMYVGIVRGSGKNDQGGAAEAFAAAKSFDPGVQLDAALATPETKQTFDSAAGGAAPADPGPSDFPEPGPIPSGTAPGAAPPPAGVPGDMLCSPQGAPIGTNMPIPVSCSTDADAAEGFIKFKEPGGSDWKKIALQNFDGQWQAEIPCKFTATAGELQFYIGVKNSGGEYVDQFGSKKEPASLLLAADGVAPAFPGQAPVTRCVGGTGDADCPPDFPGCESSSDTAQCGDLDWGAACKNSSECKCGLLCESGQCATAPSCSTDAECSTGSCVDGLCSAVRDGGGDAGPFKRHWLSLTAGMDLMYIGGDDLCSEERRGNYYTYCYSNDGAYAGTYDGFPEGVDVGTGFAPGQIRAKLGYDYAITHHILVGIRATAAFLNTHRGASDTPNFFMPHLEARGTYTFTSLSHDGIRPSVYLAGGLAGVDGKLVTGSTEVYKLAGNQFVSLGGAVAYNFSETTGVGLDVQFMIPLPQIATVLHPALSFTQGF